MGRWRAHRSGKRDKNHKEIQDGLIAAGYPSYDTSRVGYGFGDILTVVSRDRIILFEVKEGNGKLNEQEEAFFKSYPGEIYCINSLQMALLIIKQEID